MRLSSRRTLFRRASSLALKRTPSRKPSVPAVVDEARTAHPAPPHCALQVTLPSPICPDSHLRQTAGSKKEEALSGYARLRGKALSRYKGAPAVERGGHANSLALRKPITQETADRGAQRERLAVN